MANKTLKEAFNTIYHDEELFEHFCNSDIASEVTEFRAAKRTVLKVSGRMKDYLSFIDKVILRHLNVNQSVVHSYIKGKSVVTAVKEHVASRYFFMTDIKEFFLNITDQDVLEILSSNTSNIPLDDIVQYIPRLIELTCWKGTIPIGYATSPRISNAFLSKFDTAMSDYCLMNGLIYTRYADDLIISSQEIEKLDLLRSDIQGMLEKYSSNKMKINESKTRINHIGQNFTILGLVILPNGELTINKKYKKSLETAIHFFINDQQKYLNFLEKEFKGSQRSLFGLFHYVKSVDSNYIDKLQRKYGVYSINALLENKWND